MYQPRGVAARRLVLCGRWSRRCAVGAPGHGLHCRGVQAGDRQACRGVFCFVCGSIGRCGRSAGAAQASYVHHHQTQAEARTLARVVIGVADVNAVIDAFTHSTAVVAGVEYARSG